MNFIEFFLWWYVLVLFNKIKVLIPLEVQLKTMKNIIKKRIEFLKITIGDNF
jgi:hypothetical protein